jgi:hypothetical protein
MEEPTRLIASATLLLALCLAGQTQAAPFDEKVKVPRAANSQALRTKFEAHFATFQRKQHDPDPAAFIRDRLAHRQWTDLYFSVKLAMDEGKPLEDLGAFGLVAKPDGTYVIDLRAYPQWEPLDSRLSILSSPEIVESYLPALKARGFRDEDVSALRTYVATHDARLTVYANGRELVDTFAKRLQAQRQAGQPLNLQQVLAYRYQKNILKAEATRQWAIGLLDRFDGQRQRILASFLDEFQSEMVFGRASEPLDQTLEQEVAPIVSGAYLGIIAGEEAQLRLEIERRTDKLMEGESR